MRPSAKSGTLRPDEHGPALDHRASHRRPVRNRGCIEATVGHGTGSSVCSFLAMHQTLGGLTWVVALARLVWRRRFAYLPPFPESMPKSAAVDREGQ